MLFKLVLTFIAAAHCLPKGYKKNTESAERLHALEKELDALKHVAEPQMERRGTCLEECGLVMMRAADFFFKKVESKFGPCGGVSAEDCWDNMGKHKRFLKLFAPEDPMMCDHFCKIVAIDPLDGEYV